MLPSTGKFKEINCPFFDSGLCERPYCHFRHVKKDTPDFLPSSVVNAGPSSLTAISLGDNGEILQQLVSEAVRKVLEQTDLPLALPNANSGDVSRNLLTKVTEVLAPPLAVSSTSQNTFNTSSSLQKIPSYKPTPISLLKNKQNRHIPIPYSPTLCKSGSILRKRSSSEDASLLQKKLKKPDHVDLIPFSSVYGSDSPSSSSCIKTYDPELQLVEEHLVPDDRVRDSSQYSPVPIKGWKDNGLKYTPSSIETLKQNAYIPSSRVPSEGPEVTYEPSEKSKSSVEPTYEPLAPDGSSVGETPYEPSRVSNVEPEYQPLCCDSTAKEYVPTDISKLENIEDEDLDITQKIELLHNYLHDEFNSIETGKTKTGVGGLNCDVSSSIDLHDVVSSSESSSLLPEKIKRDSDRDKSESVKRKSDERHRHVERRKSDSDKKGDEKKKRDRKSDSGKKRNENDKKQSESSKSISGVKKSEKEKRSGDSDKRKNENKYKSEHESEKREELEPKKKSESEKRLSTDKKHGEHNHKRTESDRKRDSEKKKSEHEKKKSTSVSKKRIDNTDKSSSSSVNHKHKSNSISNNDKHSSKSSSESHISSRSVSGNKNYEIKRHSPNNKKSVSRRSGSNAHVEKHNEYKRAKSVEKTKLERKKKPNVSDHKIHKVLVKSSKKIVQVEEIETSGDVTMGNSVSESELSGDEDDDDVEDILDSVTLPNDTWASSDEDTVTKECYRIFQEYEPSNTSKKPSAPIPSHIELSKEENYIPIVKKHRVAHEGADHAKSIRPVIKKSYGPTPSQTLSERFQKMRETFAQCKTSLPGQPVLLSPPSPALQSPPLPIARLDSKPSVSQLAPAISTIGVKKRIAHVPNVSVLLDAKMKMQQKIKEKLLYNEKCNSLPGGMTKAQSVTKGSQRVAHMPSEQLLMRPIIKEIGGKIPSNVRQNYLNILVDEYLKISPSEQEAYEKAEEEEKAIFARSTTRAIYTSHVSNTINRLRKAAHSGRASTSTRTDDKIVNRTVSHTSMLAGRVGTKGSWSIEKPRKPSTTVSSKTLYELLSVFIMTEEQLKDNGFPMSHAEEKGVAVIHSFYKKPFVPKTPQQRMCARCSKIYYVNLQGKAVKDENCVYHWGRMFQSKTRGGWEARYNCCQGHAEAIGCSVGACHVSDNFDPTNLRGFVKTLPKEKPPPDGDYGVYALDCEMCYTTLGLELTRVTVIGTDLQIVYESLVRPESTILDYNTRFSGIREEDLEKVTTNIYEVQSVLLSFINDKTIIIGHSLESDFKALKLIHSTVVDTSIVYPHKMGPPKKRALKTLCRDLLQKIIQESDGGHDSAEDARAAMEIMLFKIKEDMKAAW